MRSRNRRFWRRMTRGLISLCVIGMLCALLFPLPMIPAPSETPEKDLSQPFPCQDRPCGCRSADQCWKKCCCFTNSQKVAWAKANNVTPPDFVVAAAQKKNSKPSAEVSCCKTESSPIVGRTERQRAPAVPLSCCKTEPLPIVGRTERQRAPTKPYSCCKTESSPIVGRTERQRAPAKPYSCCNTEPSPIVGRTERQRAPAVPLACCSPEPLVRTSDNEFSSIAIEKTRSENKITSKPETGTAKATHRHRSTNKWVMAIYAAECQGQGSFWLGLPPSIVPERLTLPNVPFRLAGHRLPESERLQSASLSPPLPPPKIG